MHDLELLLKPSIRLSFVFVTIFLVTSIVLCTLHIPLLFKLAGYIWLITYSGHILWKDILLRNKNAIIKIRYHAKGTWTLESHTKMYDTVQLRGDSTITKWITLLRFHTPKNQHPQTCVLSPDSLPPDIYRKLLVILRTEKRRFDKG